MNTTEILTELKKLRDFAENQANNDEIIDLEGACKILNCSKSYLYQKTMKREIPFFKPSGKKIFFSKMEVIKWIKQKRIKTKSEIEKESITYLSKG